MKKFDLVSFISNPRIVLAIVMLEVLRREETVGRLQLVAGILILGSSILLWIYAKDPNHFSFNIAKSRVIRYLNLTALSLYLVALLVSAKSEHTISAVSIILLATVGLLVMAIAMKYKASAHIAYMTVGLITTSAHPILFPFTLIPIAYARYKSEKHTIPQLIVGFGVAIMSFVAVTSIN